ncbi:MAG TPA: UDP-glucose 4-epimerase GalE [Bacilli bacterium]|nr:UDP-glucose 4-epimerase GalE [Bacilli bacterium]
MKILVTGGTGFIGSHTVVELIKAKHEVVIVDNLLNSQIKVLDYIHEISGVKPVFYEVDVADKAAMSRVFLEHKFDAVIHFAGLKAVGESVEKPLLYYRSNIESTLALLELMYEYGVYNILFSSSATVYGTPETMPIKETDPLGGTTNPYATTKLMIEQILMDFVNANQKFKAVSLRYFNPIGAHPSALIGESPNDIPNNLMPYISKVANGKLEILNIFGDDYDTVDGTGVRDYVHVSDLAVGHVLALKAFNFPLNYNYYNLGTGKGTSVFELVRAYEKANNLKINYVIKGRRSGDVAMSYADITKARKELGFVPKYSIIDACRHAYLFEQNLK